MQTLFVLLAVLVLWVIGYRILGRVCFPNRLKKWEAMEDMVNEGSQTSCLLLLSGVAAVVAGTILSVALEWR